MPVQRFVIASDEVLIVQPGGKILGADGAGGGANGIASLPAASGGDAPTEAEFNAVVTALNSALAALRNLGIICRAPS